MAGHISLSRRIADRCYPGGRHYDISYGSWDNLPSGWYVIEWNNLTPLRIAQRFDAHPDAVKCYVWKSQWLEIKRKEKEHAKETPRKTPRV